MRRTFGQRKGLVLLVAISALSVPAFALASLSLNSTPVPREFNGWAAVFADAGHVAPRVFLTMTPSTPGAYGAHPVVEYGVTVCNGKVLDGVLVLAGDARIRIPSPASQPVPAGPGQPSISYLPKLPRLVIKDFQNGAVADVAPVQVLRVRIPSTPCRATYDPESPKWEGRTVVVRGPLEGQTVHQSFAPFGLWPVRQAQSWPYLGQVPVFNPIDRGAFRLDRRLPGLWVRPLQSYFGVDVGLLDGKASVDFARPVTTDGLESLAWAGIKPMAAKARVTNTDNLNKWQTVSLATGIWLGLGGSVLATVALEAIRRGRPRPAVPQPRGSMSHDQPRLLRRSKKANRHHALLGLGFAALAFLFRRAWRDERRP